MAPVVSRSLQSCLAVIALLMSALGSLRAAVERPFDECGDAMGPVVADARCVRASATARSAATETIARSPASTGCAPVSVDAPIVRRAPSPFAPPVAAPTQRLGAANGPRAP